MGSTVFVIDSSPAVHRMVEQLFTTDGHKVVGFHDGPAALEAARSDPNDALKETGRDSSSVPVAVISPR